MVERLKRVASRSAYHGKAEIVRSRSVRQTDAKRKSRDQDCTSLAVSYRCRTIWALRSTKHREGQHRSGVRS